MALELTISKKEKKMLIILGIVLVGIGYYEFYNLFTSKQLAQTTSQLEEIKTKYDNVIDTIKNIENQRGEMVALKSDVDQVSEKFYPVLSEEHFIKEIDKMLIDCEAVDGGVTFEPIVNNGLYYFKASNLDIGNAEGSLKAPAQEYMSKYGEQNETQKSSEGGDVKEAADKAAENSSKNEDTSVKAIFMTGNINYYGTYENLIKLVNIIDEHEYRMSLTGLDNCELNDDDSNFIKTSIKILVYAIPKLNDEKDKYLLWSINNEYGKKEPFFYSTELSETAKVAMPDKDFAIDVNATASDMYTASVGKVNNDTMRSEYAYASGNNKEKVTVEINEYNGKYYYKCSAGNNSIPQNGSSLGKEFTPYGQDIIIDASSEPRIGDKDNNKVNISIVNNASDKKVIINISNDDIKEPRISVDADKKNVIINRK